MSNNIYCKSTLKRLIDQHLERKLITVKQSTEYPNLRVVKYARRCFYDNIWNDFLKECRGLVIDQDYNIVVNPLTKIFNYGENGWYPDVSLDDEVAVYRKYNGFLGCVTNTEKFGRLFSTTGSLDSRYCDLIKETWPVIKDHYPNIGERIGATYYFEICHPSDPHIIREEKPFYYLGQRDYVDGNVRFELSSSNKEYCKLGDLFKRSEKIEGWVVKTLSDQPQFFKIKTPYYLRQKFFARANINKLENVLKHGSTVNEGYLSNFDEDLYHIVDIVRQNKDEFFEMNEQQRIDLVENFLKGV